MGAKLKRGKRTGLVYFSLDDIRAWGPCYDPAKYATAWRGTALDILSAQKVPAQDRLWVVCREGIVSERTLRLFAVWCARQVQHLMKDPRSLAALDVAERCAQGQATEAERVAAVDAARDAARAAARDAARAAAGAAARIAAGDAAWAAAGVAAWAAGDAAGDAARAAWDAAWVAAGDAAWAAGDAQCVRLAEMVRAEGLAYVAAKGGE